MKIMSFLNNNSTLFFSWYCVLLCCAINYINFKGVRYTYLMYVMLCLFLLLIVFIAFSIILSFYQSIKNININKVYAFVLLIFYLVFSWMFVSDILFFGISSETRLSKLYIFICINICILFCLYHKFKKQSIFIISYLFFYGVNFSLIFDFLLNSMIHDC